MASEPASAERQISVLERFATDSPDLEELTRLTGEFDALNFLGLSSSEETHSDILAWLLNPGQNHGAGDCFLKDFLVRTGVSAQEEVQSHDWSGTTVRREWPNVVDDQPGFLDILVLNEGENFACAIENKIFSSEHSAQLTRYRKALEARYPRLRRSHVFLSPGGVRPEDEEDRASWIPVDYGKVLLSVEYTLQRGVDQEHPAAAFLRQYITTLRRNIVPDTSVQQLATRLYLQHREAIDLINRHKEAYIRDLMQFCQEAVMQQGNWIVDSLHDGKTPDKMVGFFHSDWKRFDSFRAGTGWNQGSDAALRFHFDLRDTGRVNLILTIPRRGESDEATRSELFNMGRHHHGIFDHRGSRYGGSYTTSWIRLHVSEPVVSEEDLLNWDREGARQTTLSWFGKFAADEFPAMNEAIVACFRKVDGSRR